MGAAESELEALCSAYLAEVVAYSTRERPADERLLRRIEDHLAISDEKRREHRLTINNYVGALRIEGKVFKPSMSADLERALKAALLEGWASDSKST